MGSFQALLRVLVVSGRARNECLLYLRKTITGRAKLAALSVDLVAYVHPEVHPPDLAFVEVERLGLRIESFLLFVPAVEVFRHTRMRVHGSTEKPANRPAGFGAMNGAALSTGAQTRRLLQRQS